MTEELWFRFPTVARNFWLVRIVLTDSETHPASISMGTGGSSPGNITAWAWSWQITTVVSKLGRGDHTSTLPYAFTGCTGTAISYFYPLIKRVKSGGIRWNMLVGETAFHFSDFRDLEIWNWCKQTSQWTHPVFVLLEFVCFKPQLTAFYASAEF